jgi:hypothetical protein
MFFGRTVQRRPHRIDQPNKRPGGIKSQEDIVCDDECAEGACLADRPRLVIALRIVLIEKGDDGRVDDCNSDWHSHVQQSVVQIGGNREWV